MTREEREVLDWDIVTERKLHLYNEAPTQMAQGPPLVIRGPDAKEAARYQEGVGVGYSRN